MMPKLKANSILYLFLSIWLLLGLLQAGFTQLSYDEAYYWVCSQHLDWGYFHHPPGIKVLIAAGYSLFHNELGVRLVTTLLSVATLYIVYVLCDRTKPWLFIAITASMLLVHLANFLAVPDTALIFFTALFLFSYKHYLKNDGLGQSLLLGLLMAAMLYSKYHGIIIIGLVVLSNLSLLKKPRFWLAVGLAIILFVPHLYWQWQHHFPTPQYYLLDRNQTGFSWSYPLGFIGGQLAIMGPLMGFVVLPAALLYKTTSQFEKALKYCLVGILGFFLAFSFRGRIEANWTATAFIPLIILSYRYINSRPKWITAVKYLTIPSVALLLAFRFYLLVDYLPFETRLGDEYHGWESYTQELQQKANGLPVVFMNTYQAPSMYSFYTGQPAYSLSNYRSKGNQYDLWDTEQELQGKTVLLMPNYNMPGCDTIYRNGKALPYKVFSNFRSYNYVHVEPKDMVHELRPGETAEQQLTLKNTINQPIDLPTANGPVYLGYMILQKGKISKDGRQALNLTQELPQGIPANGQNLTLQLEAPIVPGTYYLRFCITAPGLPPGMNSRFYKLKVE